MTVPVHGSGFEESDIAKTAICPVGERARERRSIAIPAAASASPALPHTEKYPLTSRPPVSTPRFSPSLNELNATSSSQIAAHSDINLSSSSNAPFGNP